MEGEEERWMGSRRLMGNKTGAKTRTPPPPSPKSTRAGGLSEPPAPRDAGGGGLTGGAPGAGVPGRAGWGKNKHELGGGVRCAEGGGCARSRRSATLLCCEHTSA